MARNEDGPLEPEMTGLWNGDKRGCTPSTWDTIHPRGKPQPLKKCPLWPIRYR